MSEMDDLLKGPKIFVDLMLAGWSESHTSGVKVTFWLADDADLEPFRMLTVKKGKTAGQLFRAALFLVDEQEKEPMPKRSHHSSDAHLMVTSSTFSAYLQDTVPSRLPWTGDRAKLWAKAKLGLESLSLLDTNDSLWDEFRAIIQAPYREWMERHERTARDDAADLPVDGEPREGD